MTKLLLITALMLTVISSSCTKEFGTSINDLIGTEWSYQGSDGTLGLKFYANNVVSSFLDNKYGVETINGTQRRFRSRGLLGIMLIRESLHLR